MEEWGSSSAIDLYAKATDNNSGKSGFFSKLKVILAGRKDKCILFMLSFVCLVVVHILSLIQIAKRKIDDVHEYENRGT